MDGVPPDERPDVLEYADASGTQRPMKPPQQYLNERSRNARRASESRLAGVGRFVERSGI
jgi:hypothetical protein